MYDVEPCVDKSPRRAGYSNREIGRFLRPSCPHPMRSIDGLRSQLRQESGLTLVEMMATLTLIGILAAMSIAAMSNYLAARSMDSAVADITSQIREANSLAVATGNTYRLDFSASASYTLQRRSGSEWVNVHASQPLPGGVAFSASSLPQFGGDRYMEFYARGTSEGGQLVLQGRFGNAKTIIVDGETVNVR